MASWLWQSPPVEWATERVEELLIGALKQGPIPQHVAFEMDGNRRFARNRKMETVEGHNLGFEAMASILEVCYKCGIKVVTVYAFSIENFHRSKFEVDALMEMAKVKLSQIAQHGDLLDRYGSKIRVVGNRDMLRPDVLEAMDKAVEMTSRNGDAVLNICFPYTSRDEITAAIKNTVDDFSKPLSAQPRPFSQTRITQKIRSQNLSATTSSLSLPTGSSTPSTTSDAEDSISSSTTLHTDSPSQGQNGQDAPVYPDPEMITSEIISEHMYVTDDPPLELLIRTSGVKRLSDFMLWQGHQSAEIVFLNCLWPEFNLWKFLPVLVEWQWSRKYDDREEARALKKASKMTKAA